MRKKEISFLMLRDAAGKKAAVAAASGAWSGRIWLSWSKCLLGQGNCR